MTPLKNKRQWDFNLVIYLAVGVLVVIPLLSFFWDIRIAIIELCCSLIVIIYGLLKKNSFIKSLRNIATKAVENLGADDTYALEQFPLPVLIVSPKLEIIWYNEKTKENIFNSKDYYGAPIKNVVNGFTKESPAKLISGVNVTSAISNGGKIPTPINAKKYTIYGSIREDGNYQLYFVDNTALKNVVNEYNESRPVIAVIMIDNYDELMQNAKEGEKTEIVGIIERTLSNWVGQTSGFLRHSDRDKYLFVLEERHFKRIVESRFDILEKVRKITVNDFFTASLSIGVGRGANSFAEAEEMARQALDMALGRGGDQVAVKTEGGYEFYGGTSKVVEKRTKVKTRIVASAMTELIDGSDNVLIMGHKSSDLDCIGSAAAIYKAVLSRGCNARIVASKKTSLAAGLMNMLEKNGFEDAFVEPEESLFLVTPKTLLIIVDTHRKGYVEYPELYNVAKTIMVIDHHRKMVDYIDNAVIFYHEPYASSASEMVTELVQYFSDKSVGLAESTALLAGIMLDTKNFSIRTGVRTFEAAAYLKRKGADTSCVKELFSNSLEDYKARTALVESAQIYKNCAIVVSKSENYSAMRYLAPQTADELLSITAVDASFVIYLAPGCVSVSARSMGKVNVQLVMEKIGGGGHLTMAGAQLKDVETSQVRQKIIESIDSYLIDNPIQPSELG